MELNPNHPVTRAVSEHWHKIAALLMFKYKIEHAVITIDDIKNMPNSAIAVQELSDGIHIRLIDGADAERLARKEGGLPV